MLYMQQGTPSHGAKLRRSINALSSSQVPDVETLPCTRRFLCELEVAARTSDNYLPQEPQVHEGRDPSEEVAPEEVDPITEMQIEAVRAIYRSVVASFPRSRTCDGGGQAWWLVGADARGKSFHVSEVCLIQNKSSVLQVRIGRSSLPLSHVGYGRSLRSLVERVSQSSLNGS